MDLNFNLKCYNNISLKERYISTFNELCIDNFREKRINKEI